MKYIFAAAATSLLLTSCSTSAPVKCIPKSKAGGQPINFGSAAAGDAYVALPSYQDVQASEEKAATLTAQVDNALNTYNMPPRAETEFVRQRLAANKKLFNTPGIQEDISRLLELNQLHPNEGPYLRAYLSELPIKSEKNYDRDAEPLVRIPPLLSQAMRKGDNSGHCVLQFDVSTEGKAKNVKVGYCTKDIFRETSVKSLEN